MKTGAKYRFYPDKEQELLIAKTSGCTRFVWNHILAFRNDQYQQGVRLNSKAISKALTALKREPENKFLKEVSMVPLQQALINQNKAFERFFKKKSAFPQVKRKHNRQSFTLMKNAFKIENHQVFIAKCKTPLNIVWSRKLPGEVSSLTISKEPSGKYFISFVCGKPIKPLPVTGKICGIDIGLKDLLCFDNGDKVKDLKSYLKYEQEVKFLQRKLSRFDEKRKKLGFKASDSSRKREKLRIRLARVKEKIAFIRKDFIHKLTTNIVKENQIICVEDLAVKNMIKNRRLSRRIHEAAWGEILRQLTYKSLWYGRTLVKISRWYPSSKTCSTENCGYVMSKLPLSVRSWVCPSCGTNHDRDINAARNIKASGLLVLASRV